MSDVSPARIGLLFDYLEEGGSFDENILPTLGTRTLDEIATIIAEANGAPAGSPLRITVPVAFGAIAAGLSSNQPQTAVAAVALLIRSRPGTLTAHEIPLTCREGTPARHAAQIAVSAALNSDNDATE